MRVSDGGHGEDILVFSANRAVASAECQGMLPAATLSCCRRRRCCFADNRPADKVKACRPKSVYQEVTDEFDNSTGTTDYVLESYNPIESITS
jgi:hypothetical protein